MSTPNTATEAFRLIRHPAFVRAYEEIQFIYETGPQRGRYWLTCLVGGTGAGKSCVVEKFVSDKSFGASEVDRGEGVIRVDLNGSATPKSIVLDLLRKLGAYHPKSLTLDELIEHLVFHLRDQNIRLIILDEANHFVEQTARSGVRVRSAADFIKALLNKAVCSVLLVGLQSIKELLNSNAQLQRRCRAIHYMMPYTVADYESEETFRRVLKGLTSDFRLPTSVSTVSVEFAHQVFGLTEGWFGFIVQLFLVAEEAAGRRKAQIIELCDFSVAADHIIDVRRLGIGNPFRKTDRQSASSSAPVLISKASVEPKSAPQTIRNRPKPSIKKSETMGNRRILVAKKAACR